MNMKTLNFEDAVVLWIGLFLLIGVVSFAFFVIKHTPPHLDSRKKKHTSITRMLISKIVSDVLDGFLFQILGTTISVTLTYVLWGFEIAILSLLSVISVCLMRIESQKTK